MLFNVEEDHGFRIRCYLIPDAGGATPSLRLYGGGAQIALVKADTVRPEIVASGRHATGLCGFDLSEAIIPNLSRYDDLELREAETDFLIYRRQRPGFVQAKLFRLETHLLPLNRFDDVFHPHFQFWFRGVDRLGLETSLQAFMLSNCASLYVSGRIQFQTIETNLRDFHSVTLIRDPYFELAERLLVLRNLPQDADGLVGERDLMTFKPVAEYLRGFEQLDERFCKTFTKRTPDSVAKVLANPVMRLLASSNPDELPKKNAMAAALQALSYFDVVGVRDEPDAFSAAVAELIPADVSLPVMTEYAKVAELGALLRRSGKIEALIEQDLELFDHVRTAFAAAHAPRAAVN